MSSTTSPCAACKLLRRKCTQECVFAPYFPPDNPQKFSNVHKVFGASNVTKLLNELDASQREDAVNSLAYEAEYRLRDPVYGCVGLISVLQHKLSQVKNELLVARKELANYIGPSAMMPMMEHPGFLQQHPGNVAGTSAGVLQQYGMQQPMMGVPTGVLPNGGQLMIRDPQQQQQQHLMAAQQLAAVVAATDQREMMRSLEQQHQQQHQQHEMARFNNGFEGVNLGVTASGFNQMNGVGVGGGGGGGVDALQQPSLALGSFDRPYHHHNHIQQHGQEHPHAPHHHHHNPHQLQLQPQLMLHQQPPPLQQQESPATTTTQQLQHQMQQQQQQHRAKSEEHISLGPSC